MKEKKNYELPEWVVEIIDHEGAAVKYFHSRTQKEKGKIVSE
jgi:hypothetical protein